MGHIYFLQFARTGNLCCFDYAETVARHYMDVDMIWSHSEVRHVGGGLSIAQGHRRMTAVSIDFAELSG